MLTSGIGRARLSRHTVHIIDPAGPATPARAVLARGAAADIVVMACAEAIRARPAEHHTVIVTGSAETLRHARRLGLHAVDARCSRIAAPLGCCIFGYRSLRHHLAGLPAVDLLQPWSERARTMCALAAGGRIPIAEVPTGIMPPFGAEGFAPPNDVRAQIGVDARLPLVGMLCDPVHHADTRRFVYMVGTLHVAGHEVAGLIDRRAAHTARARRFHAESGVGWRMRMAPEPTPFLLHACDIAMVLPPTAHPTLREDQAAWVRWSVLRAHLLGVPVIGAAEWLPEAYLGETEPELLSPWSGTLRDMIRRLIALVDDPERLHQTAAAVQRAASHAATGEALSQQIADAWSNAEPIRSETGIRAFTRGGVQTPA